METVSFELIRDIRNHIGRTEKQAMLLENRKKWLRLTSALDALEDASWAVEYYLETPYPPTKKGGYLFTHGLLQVLFVQQDAVNSISIALLDKKIDFRTEFPTVFSIREMRNDVTGHPTFRDNHYHIYLAQCSLSKETFYYIKENSDTGKSEIINVKVYDAISEIACCINSILEGAVDALDAEFKVYIEKHRVRKMQNIFTLLHYAKEKVLLEDVMSEWGYNATKDMVQKCEEELIMRYGSIDAVDSYRYLLENIHETYDLIDMGLDEIPAEYRHKICNHLLQGLFYDLEKLCTYCEETDRYFENYGEEKLDDNETTTGVIIIPDIEDGKTSIEELSK